MVSTIIFPCYSLPRQCVRVCVCERTRSVWSCCRRERRRWSRSCFLPCAQRSEMRWATPHGSGPSSLWNGQIQIHTISKFNLWKPVSVSSPFFSISLFLTPGQVNVPMGSLGEPVLMGVALNHTSSGRPSAEFYIRYGNTSAQEEISLNARGHLTRKHIG